MNKTNYAGFVYEWTNKINGRKYIGSHIGLESDSYTGSGVDFRKDLKQFGVISFTRTILEYVEKVSDLPTIERQYLEKVNARDNLIYYNKTNGSSVSKKEKHAHSRTLCIACNSNPQAVNYIDPNGITHYRKKCASCIRTNKKVRKEPPAWQKAGYKKKIVCEKCGFKAKMPEQLNVFYIDGNLKNTNHFNLKTVCLNCQPEIYKSRLAWKPSPILPDF